jgi:hypothetical protein
MSGRVQRWYSRQVRVYARGTVAVLGTESVATSVLVIECLSVAVMRARYKTTFDLQSFSVLGVPFLRLSSELAL